jgi:hypothetical protein
MGLSGADVFVFGDFGCVTGFDILEEYGSVVVGFSDELFIGGSDALRDFGGSLGNFLAGVFDGVFFDTGGCGFGGLFGGDGKGFIFGAGDSGEFVESCWCAIDCVWDFGLNDFSTVNGLVG